MLKIQSIILTGMVLFGNGSLADHNSLQAFEASYKLYSKGTEVAVINRTFTHIINNEYVYRSESRTVGLVSLFRDDHIIEESRWKLEGKKLHPLEYQYQHSGSKKARDVGIHFDWEENRIYMHVNDNNWDMPLPSGVLDKLLYQYAIMYDLNHGEFPGTYTIADGGKIKIYHFENLGRESIQTPLGDLETIKVLRKKPNDTRQSIFWCALKFQYLPIRVEHTEKDGGKTTAVIESLIGLSSN